MPRLFEKYKRNTTGRDFVVGDIHGHYYMLQALLAHVDFDESCDRLFSVGDLADWGPESERLTEFLREDWFHAIRGNHEQLMIKGAHTIDSAPTNMVDVQLWLSNGGEWFFQQSLDDQAMIYRKVQQLPYGIEVEIEGGVAGLVHGQVLNRSWLTTRGFLIDPFALDEPEDGARVIEDREKALETLVWGRSDALAAKGAVKSTPTVSPDDVAVSGAAVVFLGHTPMSCGPVRVANTRWIDVGVSHGELLALAEVAVDGRVWCIDPDLGDVVDGWVGAGQAP